MNHVVYIAIGVITSGIVLVLTKLFGSRKGQEVKSQDDSKSLAAIESAATLMGEKAMAQAQSEADRQKIKDKLLIKDPAKRLEALAEELKDL